MRRAAYLFAARAVSAKTTTARAARACALLCPDRKDAEACGKCAVVTMPARPWDVIEIDRRVHRGIEGSHTLREEREVTSALARALQGYIIDESINSPRPAFNALLKTWKSRPLKWSSLATTDPRDITATVLSRCSASNSGRSLPTHLGDARAHLSERKIPFDAAARFPKWCAPPRVRCGRAVPCSTTAHCVCNGRLDAETTAGLLGTTAPAEVRAFATA